MAMALRYDTAELRKATKLPNGHIRLDSNLTKAGIFVYRNPDGTERREYRPPAEVFKADSLDTFAMVPVTNNHPPVLLDAVNTKDYQVGTVGENIRQDGEFVRASMVITDAKTIADIEAGKVQVSCGYIADTDYTPGSVNGQRYDAVQTNIRGNHVAIVARGKAGPEARVRLDADEAEMIGDAPKDAEKTMKITINGVEYDIADVAAQAVLVERGKFDSLLAAEKSAVAVAQAKADAATEKLTVAEKARMDASDPKVFGERVNARVALVTVARDVLPPEVTEPQNGSAPKLDSMDDAAIKAAVLTKLVPDVKLDGKAPSYLDARYDIAIEDYAKRPNAGLAALRTATTPAGVKLDAAEVKLDADESRKKMNAANRDAGRAPLTQPGT